MKESEKVRYDKGVREDFRQRMEAVKAAVRTGEIPFNNPPSDWTDELLNIAALKLVLAHLDSNAKLN